MYGLPVKKNKKALDKYPLTWYNKDTKREGHNPRSKGDTHYEEHHDRR